MMHLTALATAAAHHAPPVQTYAGLRVGIAVILAAAVLISMCRTIPRWIAEARDRRERAAQAAEQAEYESQAASFTYPPDYRW